MDGWFYGEHTHTLARPLMDETHLLGPSSLAPAHSLARSIELNSVLTDELAVAARHFTGPSINPLLLPSLPTPPSPPTPAPAPTPPPLSDPSVALPRPQTSTVSSVVGRDASGSLETAAAHSPTIAPVPAATPAQSATASAAPNRLPLGSAATHAAGSVETAPRQSDARWAEPLSPCNQSRSFADFDAAAAQRAWVGWGGGGVGEGQGGGGRLAPLTGSRHSLACAPSQSATIWGGRVGVTGTLRVL